MTDINNLNDDKSMVKTVDEMVNSEITDSEVIDSEDDDLIEELTAKLADDDIKTSGFKTSGFKINTGGHVDGDGASTGTGTNKKVTASHTVTQDEAGIRIDKLAAKVFTDFSRAQLQSWINDDKLLINGTSQKPKYRVKQGEVLSLAATLEQHGEDMPENIALEVVYEDDTVVVINKPVGMVVHPGAGNWTGTLVNALLYHYPEQKHLPRAGLVHRIDKDTSGLLLIAKTKAAQLHLTEQLKDKSVYRHYQCVVAGSKDSLSRQRHINEPIGRHPSMRTKMAVNKHGREAITHLLNITPLNDSYCLVDVQLETGRTHQIRVHLSHIGHPLVGDKVYGGRKQLRAGLSEAQRLAVTGFTRQALHAYKLGFVHPVTQQNIEVTAPLPQDIQTLMDALSEQV